MKTLTETRDGALWLGTKAQGVLRWQEGAAAAVPTAHSRINDFCEDDAGNVWAATAGGGLNQLRPARFTLLGEDAGLLPKTPDATDCKICARASRKSAGSSRSTARHLVIGALAGPR